MSGIGGFHRPGATTPRFGRGLARAAQPYAGIPTTARKGGERREPGPIPPNALGAAAYARARVDTQHPARRGAVSKLPSVLLPLEQLSFVDDKGRTLTLEDWLRETCTHPVAGAAFTHLLTLRAWDAPARAVQDDTKP